MGFGMEDVHADGRWFASDFSKGLQSAKKHTNLGLGIEDVTEPLSGVGIRIQRPKESWHMSGRE